MASRGNGWSLGPVATFVVAFVTTLAMASAQAGEPEAEKPLHCERVLRPHAPVDANGQRVSGDITIDARFVRGRLDNVEFRDGRADLLLAAQAKLRELRCQKLAEPRTLRMTLTFSGGAEQDLSPPFKHGGNAVLAHNAFIREHFPTRVDALLTLPAMDFEAYGNVGILKDSPVELDSEAELYAGTFKVKLMFLLDTDGTASDFLVISDAPSVFHRLSIAAMKRARFSPATYAGLPVPAIVEREFEFNMDDGLDI
ncbi:energy transducer TonB [Roseateles sp.]|uniref:energy transducer TonB n=1 Tax=Roseateles sp. TaxID=1971397 RepID=UPI002F3F0497